MTERAETVRFTAFSALNDAELRDLQAIAGTPRKLRRGDTLRAEGGEAPGLYLLLSGWTTSSVTFASGGRQMLKVHIPGDMLGIPSMPYRHAVDTITALSAAVVCTVSPRALGELFVNRPRLAALLYLIAQEERVMLIDRLATMGRSSAGERLAALILQLHARMLRNDPALGLSFHVPINQADLGDLVGITMVHVSRVLQQLRAQNLLQWGRQTVTILDLEGLQRYSGLPSRELDREPEWLPPR